MRSSESPLASLPCPNSVGHPSLPLLLDLDKNEGGNLKTPLKRQLVLTGGEEREILKKKSAFVWSWFYFLSSLFHMQEVVES